MKPRDPEQMAATDSDPKSEAPAADTGAVRSSGSSSSDQPAPTGIIGSEPERKAARILAGELEDRNRPVAVQEVRVPPSVGTTITIHALLVLAGSLIGLKSPLAGAGICLITAFSFYGERALGIPLIGRLLPGRKTRNVISPPPGTVWEKEIDVVFAAGYDVPENYPAGEWLERRFGGRLTTDRILLWGGMILTFFMLVLRVAEVAETWLSLLQLLGAAILLAAIAAQIDRRLAGEPVGQDEDLAPTHDLLAALDEAEEEGSADGIAICFFGAESADAAGAEAFFSDRRLKVKPTLAVIGLLQGTKSGRLQISAREGDLSTAVMSPEMSRASPLEPQRVIVRRLTAAGRARRRGVRATTIIGRDDPAIDLLLDTFEGSLKDDRPKPGLTDREETG